MDLAGGPGPGGGWPAPKAGSESGRVRCNTRRGPGSVACRGRARAEPGLCLQIRPTFSLSPLTVAGEGKRASGYQFSESWPRPGRGRGASPGLVSLLPAPGSGGGEPVGGSEAPRVLHTLQFTPSPYTFDCMSLQARATQHPCPWSAQYPLRRALSSHA